MTASGVDLYWIPLGAGQHVVRVSGHAYEALAALARQRPPAALFHSALVIDCDGASYAVEMTPVPDEQGAADRGVTVTGPVGLRALGRFRLFRYEVRCWRDGVIPDLDHAVGGPVHLTHDAERAAELIELVAQVPNPTWGRDELHAGEMWNSNSVTSWLLVRAGLIDGAGSPPAGGRAPGWNAGVVAAGR